MAWLAVTLNVDADNADALSDALLAGGALAVDVADAWAGTPRERPRWGAPDPGDASAWESSRLSALFEEHADIAAQVAAALHACGLDPARGYQTERVDDQDWVRATQRQFVPLRVSPRLWVVPSWHEPPDSAAINLVIDPGLAFGTGTHPTTQLCLQWLDANLTGGESVLDYGCGSGILAIAAMKLGAGRTVGVDIDPQAVLAAARNAELNGVAADFASPDALAPGEFDIVVANILAHPLRVLAPLLAARVRRGGWLVLSGVLERQAEDVAASYAATLPLSIREVDEGWALLVGHRS